MIMRQIKPPIASRSFKRVDPQCTRHAYPVRATRLSICLRTRYQDQNRNDGSSKRAT